MTGRHVGTASSHEAARLHVSGEAKYTDDLAARLPNVVHVVPVLSNEAHAEIVELDVSEALRLSGVLSVLTRSDVPGENDVGPVRRDEPLFPSEVQFHGQPVAWVIAESEAQAAEAARAVNVRCRALPAISSIEEAILRESFLVGPERMQRGDAESALRAAPHRLEGEVFVNGQEHFYLETQSALALLDADDALRVESSTQHPSETQEIVARVLGWPKNRVVVQCLRMGGAFGGKEVQANTWAAVAALAALKTKRPARVCLSRAEDMRLTGKRHPFLGRFRVGFDEQGALLGLVLELYGDGGHSLDLSAPILSRAMFHCDNAYLLPNVSITGHVCRTHRVSNTAFRGFGGPQGMLIIEDILDRVARHLKLPPHTVRERNFYREGDSTHYGQVVRDAGRIERIWSELKTSSDFLARSEEIERYNAVHPHQKRGIALTPVKFGISFTATFFNQAGALVLVYKDGSVQVNHGGTEMGQGLHTKIQRIAADALGVGLERVRIMPTRTDKVPNTSATAASASTDLNGAAVLAACETLRGRLTEVAARVLGADASSVEFDADRVFSRATPERALSFEEIVQAAYFERVQLFATGFYRTPDIHFDRESGQGKPFHYFAYGAAVSEVEVDGFTGQYALRRVDILHDVGSSLSPLIDRGQIEGGFLQGLGWLTTEELRWDSRGALASRGASTYKLPSVAECPPIFNVRFLSQASEPGVIHGSKAVGEPPLMLALSVREALRAAVAAFGSGRVTALASPATPEAVFWAIDRAGRQRLE